MRKAVEPGRCGQSTGDRRERAGTDRELRRVAEPAGARARTAEGLARARLAATRGNPGSKTVRKSRPNNSSELPNAAEQKKKNHPFNDQLAHTPGHSTQAATPDLIRLHHHLIPSIVAPTHRRFQGSADRRFQTDPLPMRRSLITRPGPACARKASSVRRFAASERSDKWSLCIRQTWLPHRRRMLAR